MKVILFFLFCFYLFFYDIYAIKSKKENKVTNRLQYTLQLNIILVTTGCQNIKSFFSYFKI